MTAKKRAIKSDLARLDKWRDEHINYRDIPELDDKVFAQPPIAWPPKKRTRRQAQHRARTLRRAR